MYGYFPHPCVKLCRLKEHRARASTWKVGLFGTFKETVFGGVQKSVGRLLVLLAETQSSTSGICSLLFLIENQYRAMVQLLRKPAFLIVAGGAGGPQLNRCSDQVRRSFLRAQHVMEAWFEMFEMFPLFRPLPDLPRAPPAGCTEPKVVCCVR